MKQIFTRTLFFVLAMMFFSTVSAKQLYVTGDPFGGWTPGSPTPMTLADDGVTNTITISTEKTVWWTICDGADSNWDVFNSTYRYGVKAGDVDVAIGEYQLQKCNGTFKMGPGEYTITVNSETMVMTIEGKKDDVVINVVSIVGELSGGWDAEANAFDLTQTGDGVWTGTMTDFVAEAKKYEWKVVANHEWGVFDIPEDNSNLDYTFESDGKYDVEFTVDLNAKTAEINAVKKEDVVIEKDYYVAGQEAILGVEWIPNEETNKMEKQDDGTYKLTKEVELTAGVTYEFKVVTNGDWNQPSFGADTASGNYEFSVDADGTYEVTFVFDPSTETITLILEPSTAIGYIHAGETVKSAIYNLRGQRVNAATKGVFIVNGKKVAVK